MSWRRHFYPQATHGDEVTAELRGVRPTPIAEARAGKVVSIGGTVRAIEPLVTSPLTHRRCVYWALSISEVMRSLFAVELGCLEGGSPFFVADGTARARVIPAGGRLASERVSWLRALVPAAPGGSWGGAEPPLINADELALFRPLRARIGATSRIRFTEYTVDDAATVLVRGPSELERDPDVTEQGYRDLGNRLLVASAGRRRLLIRAGLAG